MTPLHIDTQRVFDEVVEGALKLLCVTLARLWVVEASTGDIVLVASASTPDHPVDSEGAPTRFAKGQGLVGWVIEHRQASPESPVLFEEGSSELASWVKREGLVSRLAVPLLRGGQALGALVVGSREPRKFSKEEQEFLETFAATAALAIENARLHEETQQRLKQTATLVAVSEALGSTLELTEVFRRTTREMVRALGADMGGAWLLSRNRDQLLPLAGYHIPKELGKSFSPTPVDDSHPLIQEARHVGGPIYSSESDGDPRFEHPLVRLLPHQSLLILPMRVKEEIVGGFAIVWTRERHHFTREELRLVEGIARQAAMAIENARLLEAEREARAELAASEARYRELFENITDIVYLHDLNGKILAVNEAAVRASGYTGEELVGMNMADLITPQDLARNMEMIRRMVAGDRVSELFVAEFIRKDGSRAVLECSGRLVFKDGAPVAVQGVARNITFRRKLEERQAAFVEIVKEFATEENLDRLFSWMGKRVCELLGADRAALILVEGEELIIREMYGFEEAPGASRRRKISESYVGRVLLNKKPYVSSDMAVDPHWRDSDLVRRLGYRAALDVPIILREQVIGVLGIRYKSPRTFSKEDVALLVSVADHTAVALDRMNLLRELKTRLRETETLLTVSQAISSTLDPTETMRRVARETARALGADMVGAYLADLDQVSLRPVAGYHVPRQLLDSLLRFPIPIKGHPFLEEAWEAHRPVWSNDAQADSRIDREVFERSPHASVLFVPMIVKGTPIGGFFVVWWKDHHSFIPEEIQLVEGISRQAALAVENARLYEQHRGMVEQLRLFHQAIRAIGEAVVILDLEGRVIFVNEAFKRMYRWSEAEAVGATPASEGSRFDPPEIMKQIFTETLTGGWQGELRSRRKTGEEFPVFLTTAPVLDDQRKPVALVGVSRDLTQLKLLQAQLLQAEKLAATGQLAAGVAHEINNPLSVILGFSSLALQKHPPQALADDLDTIRTETLRAAKIVRDLLTFARPAPHERLPADLNEILRHTLALQAYHLATDQIEMIWQLTEPLPKILADRGQLQQVIMNLVLNAHQAMKTAHGRGTLRIETGNQGHEVWAKIIDDGHGIAPGFLPRIFDPFLTTKPVGQGTGLGLSVSYGIVQAHGGQLLAESTPGQGATFTILLPVAPSGADAIAPASSVHPVSGRALSVLVVDDEPSVARLLALMVEQLGHRAEVVHSGREALARLEQGSYDLVTLDLRMPQMSGQEVWRRLRTFPRCPRVIFVTGDFASDEARTFLATAGQPYLEKPFQLADFSRKIHELRL